MGQYYEAVMIAYAKDGMSNAGSSRTRDDIPVILTKFSPWGGSKLMEHSYLDNKFMKAIEFMLSAKGLFHKCRLVWAGDYADGDYEVDGQKEKENLYHHEKQAINPKAGFSYDIKPFNYIINHTKKMFVDKSKLTNNIHPLPLLTAEGNGCGGGDFFGEDPNELVGSWARDEISVSDDRDDVANYTELEFNLSE